MVGLQNRWRAMGEAALRDPTIADDRWEDESLRLTYEMQDVHAEMYKLRDEIGTRSTQQSWLDKMVDQIVGW